MNKKIIGMVHLKALPGTPKNTLNIEDIIKYALDDMESLGKGGIEYAIIENFFDTPYLNKADKSTIISMAYIIGRIKGKSRIHLGVNIQATDDTTEIELATVCGLEFIRSESFVELRLNSSGIIKPMAPKLMRKKKAMNSKVKILADINVKHSFPFVEKPVEASIMDAKEAGANGIILTGLVTGSSPSVSDAKKIKKICGEMPLFIGSGVDCNNIKDLLTYADGVIVGSSIKKDSIINNPVDPKRVKDLLESI